MSKYFFITIFSALFILITCKGRTEPSLIKEDQSEKCDKGNLIYFSLKPFEKMPPEITFSKLIHKKIELKAPDKYSNLRIDLCIDDDDNILETKQILIKNGSAQIEVFDSIEVSENLDQAKFGKQAGLILQAYNKAASPEYRNYLLIEGFGNDKDSFAAFTTGYKKQGKMELSSLIAIAGTFTIQDPFSRNGCKETENFEESFKKIGTIDLAIKYCSYLGGGNTTGYNILSFALTDNNPELDDKFQGKTFHLSGSTEKTANSTHSLKLSAGEGEVGALFYRWNHHNGCDSFYLTLPHAEYGVSASPMAGCGEIVKDAPPRINFDDSYTTHYRYRYENGNWSPVFKQKGSHYIAALNFEQPNIIFNKTLVFTSQVNETKVDIFKAETKIGEDTNLSLCYLAEPSFDVKTEILRDLKKEVSESDNMMKILKEFLDVARLDITRIKRERNSFYEVVELIISYNSSNPDEGPSYSIQPCRDRN